MRQSSYRQDWTTYARQDKGARPRDLRLARTQTSALSEHAYNNEHYPLWDGLKFIDRDPH